jgi:hypothetical protein
MDEDENKNTFRAYRIIVSTGATGVTYQQVGDLFKKHYGVEAAQDHK